MKKQILKSMLIAVAGIGLMTGTAMATDLDFSFFGTVQYLDTDGVMGLETIKFSNTSIAVTSPDADYLLGKQLILPTFTIADFSTMALSTDFYSNGFVVKDGSSVIFSADLTVNGLTQVGGTGLINPDFQINLSNIQVGSDYIMGTSTLVDTFANGNAGAMSATLQLAVSDFANFLSNRTAAYNGTYSGTAGIPITTPVPEPAAMLLFGAGLLGLSGVARRKNSN